MKQTTRRHHAWRRLGVAALLLCLLNAPGVAAKESTSPPSAPAVLTLHEAAHLLRIGSEELERLARRNEVPARRIGTRWRFNRAALLAWLNGDWRLIVTAVPPSAESGVRPEATAREEAPAGGTEEQPERIGEAAEERTAEDVFLRGQKVLLAPGEVTLDLGLFYSESDDQQLAPVPGGTGLVPVGLATVENETFTTFLFGRVGVLDETEAFASTTFRDQQSDVIFGSQTLSESSRSEFGDVRLGLRRTLLHEGPGLPDIIATIDGRIPTGDTSYALGGGLDSAGPTHALPLSITPIFVEIIREVFPSADDA